LEIGEVKGSAKGVTAPGSDKTYVADKGVHEIVVGAAAVGEVESIVGRLSLIQPNAPDFQARLEGVTAMDPTEIVDDSEGSADFDVFRVVVKLHKRVGSYGKRQG